MQKFDYTFLSCNQIIILKTGHNFTLLVVITILVITTLPVATLVFS